MDSISKFINSKLKLAVNQEKSKVALSKYVKFLGMTIIAETIAISVVSMNRAMAKVKELTPRGTYRTLEKTIEGINKWYMGWSQYYSMTQYPSQLKKIEAHVRRRLRSRIIGQQKKRRHLFNKLIKRGLSRSYAVNTVYNNDGRWAISGKFAMAKAYSVPWFINQMGQQVRSDQKRANPHWFSIDQWIRMT
jgi:hypothetical protein